MDRATWQALAEERIVDTHALLLAQRWSAAYYLAGYAVEAGLKACVLAYVSVRPEVIFERKTYSEKCWTHNIDELMKLAGLENVLLADTAANPVLGGSWSKVIVWNEQCRYKVQSQSQAESLCQAITDPSDGVMPWIRMRW